MQKKLIQPNQVMLEPVIRCRVDADLNLIFAVSSSRVRFPVWWQHFVNKRLTIVTPTSATFKINILQSSLRKTHSSPKKNRFLFVVSILGALNSRQGPSLRLHRVINILANRFPVVVWLFLARTPRDHADLFRMPGPNQTVDPLFYDLFPQRAC